MTLAARPEKERGWQAFWVALLCATLLFLPFIILDKGHFLYYGDFNAQQVPFYQMAHAAVRSGEIFWSWTTDLGANFIGSFSFYLLGSPFFWLTLPFPNEWVPYLMGPLLILKFACASFTAYLFCRRFVRSEYAVIAGLLYAFSGFSVYNVFFNHFHEAIIYFPLMLWGLERCMVDGKRGIFALAVFLSALNNYYFFIGQAIFLLIYFAVRICSRSWEVRASRVVSLFFEAIVGTAMAGVFLLPSFYAVIQNSRTEEILSGWDLLIYNKPQRFWDIIHSFFFPSDIPARPNFFPDADNKWSSMSAWLPLFGCSGMIAYMQSRRHNDWLRRMLVCCVLFALIPVLNSMFQLFNSMYYARWYYMMVLLMVLATVRCFDGMRAGGVGEHVEVNWRRAFFWSFGGTLFFALLLQLAPQSWEPDEETGNLVFGLMEYPDRFWIYVGIALAGLVVAVLLTMLHRHYPESFHRVAVFSVCAVSLLYSWYVIGLGKANAYYPSQYILNRVLEGNEKLSLPETDEWSRIDPNNDIDNLCMYWQMPGIQAFHSVVPGSIMEFYESIGISRSVSSEPGTTHYALRSLLSVKWLFDYDNADGAMYKPEDEFFEQDGKTAIDSFTYYDTQNGYRIYKNELFLPMGFAYDNYITRTEYDELSTYQRELVLLKTLVVEEEQEALVSQVLPKANLSAFFYSHAAFKSDVADRAAVTADTFTASSRGFTATATLEQPTVLFFSVPYEGGWTATVNGESVEIVRAGVGFMAVSCPSGEVNIEFSYMTPGLIVGGFFSLGAATLLILYLLIGYLARSRRTRAPRHAPVSGSEGDDFTVEASDPTGADGMPPAFAAPRPSQTARDRRFYHGVSHTAFDEEFPEGFDLHAYYRPKSEENTKPKDS